MLKNILEMIFYTGIFYGIIGTVMVGLLIIVIQHLIERRRRKKASEKMEEAIIKTMQRVVKEGIEEAKTDGKSREKCKKEHKNPKGNTRRIRRDSGK